MLSTWCTACVTAWSWPSSCWWNLGFRNKKYFTEYRYSWTLHYRRCFAKWKVFAGNTKILKGKTTFVSPMSHIAICDGWQIFRVILNSIFPGGILHFTRNKLPCTTKLLSLHRFACYQHFRICPFFMSLKIKMFFKLFQTFISLLPGCPFWLESWCKADCHDSDVFASRQCILSLLILRPWWASCVSLIISCWYWFRSMKSFWVDIDFDFSPFHSCIE